MQQFTYILVLVLLFCGNALAQTENILIQSDPSGTGSLILGPESATNEVKVNRYIPSGNWHIVSSPVANQQLGDFIANSSIVFNVAAADYDLAPYDEATNEWSPYTEAGNNNLFGVGKGYALRRTTRGIVVFKGIPNRGAMDVGVSLSVNGGWNAIGNPYTSFIRAKGALSFLTENSDILDLNFGGVYVWDQSLGGRTGDYTVITQAGYTFPTPGNETELDQDKLAVGAGFLVRVAATGEVRFRPSMQTHALEEFSPFKSAKIPWPAIRLTVNTGTMKNQTIVTFNSLMSKGLDPAYDVGKFKGNPDLAFYSQLIEDNGVDFAVQALPDKDYETYRIPLGLDLPNGGLVTFSAEWTDLPAHVTVILEDSKENTFTTLDRNEAVYATFLEPGTKGFGRFYLHTSDALVTGVDQAESSGFKVYASDRQIFVLGETNAKTLFKVYGVDGKMYYQNKAQSTNYNTIDASGFASGVYILQIAKENNTTVHKLVLPGR